ncbi:MAG: DUF4012 domain-containing protein [Patescibacteria group bacterium]|nr:DUF4012 domain-containing protein [Patescibacteria group bacterium]
MVKFKFPKILKNKSSKLSGKGSKLSGVKKFGILPLIGIFAFFLLTIVYSLFIGLSLKKPGTLLVASLKNSITAVQNKDLNQAKENLNLAHDNLKIVNKKSKFVSWVSYIPFLGGYIKDLNHGLIASGHGLDTADILLTAIEPYADVIGFSGAETKEGVESAEDKIIFILDTLDKISPQLEEVTQKVILIEKEISQINPRRYPKSFKNIEVRDQLTIIQNSLSSSKEALANIKPLLALLPKLLGQPDAKNYLLVFQNDAEIRPSGGFLTAVATLRAHKGKITPLFTKDIYELDALFGNREPAPDPIKKFLPLVYNWHLRDMNLSPDFKVSMDKFLPSYKSVVANSDYDGVIAMDTQIVVDLLKVIGKVGVANWGEYHAEIVPECNCPQVVYKMEDYATRPTYYIKENRKGMIGPLMHSILLNAMNSPRKLWPQFIEIGLKNIQAKHLMFYFPDDEEMQIVTESFNAGGRITDFNGDYFHLNDTNFAGAKSNLYVKQAVDQEIKVDNDGTIIKTITITYTNPEPQDDCNLESGGLCLNGLLRDWVRIYVPEGSELVEILGSDINPTTSKDLGKTVFEAFIELRPESRTKLIVKYKLPFKYDSSNPYNLLIQKQPGSKNHDYTITFKNNYQEFVLDGDRQLTL